MLLNIFYTPFLHKELNKLDLTPTCNLSFTSQLFEDDPIWQLWNLANNHKKIHSARFRKIVFKTTNEIVTEVPITNIFGSNNGKSSPAESLYEFSMSLKVLKKKNNHGYPSPIYFESDQDFQNNINSVENRFKQPINAMYFSWSDRLYLANQDQSHHIAAIYRQCIEQGRMYKIKCLQESYNINISNLRAFNEQYFTFWTNNLNLDKIYSVMSRFQSELSYENLNLRQNGIAVFFVKNNQYLSKKIYKFFQRMSTNNLACDFSKYLQELAING